MRVAVLGAGYAGLTVARRLERRLPESVELVVVEESGSHLVKHELHRVIRRPALAGTVTVPLSSVLSRAEHVRARVTDVDADAGVATLEADGETERLDYDLAAVCLGATTAFYDLPGVEDHALPLQSVADAARIRRAATHARDGHAVVGGAGLSGVQVAGELAALARETGRDLDVTVLEQADRVAPGFDAAFADALREELDARGVTVRTGVTVEGADAESVRLEGGDELAYDVFVWTGGIRGPDALDGERAPVGADLRVGDGTFVVGDAARVTDASETAVPASAQTAVREARVAARSIERLADQTLDAPVGAPPDGDLATYRYDSPGWVVSVGDGAVAQVGPVVLSGEPAKAAKAVVGAGHLGSVGAIREASDLVAAELGWPTGEAAELLGGLADTTGAGRLAARTDPATPGEVEYPLALPALALAEQFAPEEGLDLTFLTSLADRDHPGSPANALDHALSGVLSAVDPVGVLWRHGPRPDGDGDGRRDD